MIQDSVTKRDKSAIFGNESERRFAGRNRGRVGKSRAPGSRGLGNVTGNRNEGKDLCGLQIIPGPGPQIAPILDT